MTQVPPPYLGVALARPLPHGTPPSGVELHLGVLAGCAIVGFCLAVVLTRRRLLT